MDLAGMKRRELQALCKQHGLPAGGTNAALVARLDAALSGAGAGAEEVEEVAGVPAAKGCLKQTGGDAAEAKKVTFAAEEGRARRLRTRVIWSPIVDKAKTRGKSAQASTDSAAAEDGVSAEAGANVPLRRSRRKSVVAAEAEEVGEAVAVGRTRKRKNQDDDDGAVAVSERAGVSSRITRRPSLAGAAVLLPPAVEKKRGRGKAAGASSKLAAEAQDSESDVRNSAQVEASARITRSRRSVASIIVSPNVVENKRRRKTGDARANVELPTVSHVPRNEAPVTRSLRNRAVQVNNSMVGEIHTASQLESKTQPSRPPTRRHQQVSSSVEDKNQEQVAAVLRRSGRNYSEDVEKQPAVKEPVKRSARKSVALAALEKKENYLIEEKNTAAHVRRSTRKSIVPVKDIKVIGEKIHNANREDAVKQPATKGLVRGSRRKSVVPEVHEKEKGLIAEKNMEAHEGKSKRKSVMPVKDIKAVEGIQNAKGKDVEKQFVVKQPTRRSTRKSVLPDILENNSGLLAAEKNAAMNVRRSTRKSVFPIINEEQDHKDDERQQKVKGPIRRSRRSVAAVPLEEQSNGLHEEKMSKNPMRRSTRKSIALNEVEKVSLDHNEIVAREPERVGEEGLKLRKHRRSSLEISYSANDSRRKQQNTQIPNEKDNTGGRVSKRRRTIASEEVRSVKEANDDIIIREATKDAHKSTHEYKESGSRVQESGQVNVTREEHSSGPLLVTVTLPDKISTAQSVPVVIPGSESGDNANASSDKSEQEHSNIQAVDSHLSQKSAELDQSSCIAGLVLHNFDVSEDKSLMSKDGLSIDFTVGDREEQSPVSGEGRLGLEANASEPGEKNLANVKSTGLNAKILQHDTDIIAKETDKDVLPLAFPIEEHGEKYTVSHVAVEKIIGWEASACLQHDCDVLTKETGEASGAAPPISEDTNPEIQCNAEESIRAADLGKCPSRVSKGNPYSTSLHLEGAAADCNLPVLNADKGCSSEGRPSSFGLELMFAEVCKESYSKSVENTVGDCEEQSPVSGEGTVGLEANASESGEKSPADIMSTVLYTETLQHDTDIIAEETDKVAEESIRAADLGKCPSRCSKGNPLSTNLHVEGSADDSSLPVLNADKGYSSDGRPLAFGLELMFAEECKESYSRNAENNALEIDGGSKPSTPVTSGFHVHVEGAADDTSLPVLNSDKGYSSDGRPSAFGLELMFAEECEESYSRNAENNAVEIDGGSKPSTPVTSGFHVQSDCLEDEDVQPTECDADKKRDVDEGIAEEDFAQEKSNDQHVPAKTDLNMKLNNELAGPGAECITEKNARLVADNLDEQAIILVQQGDVQEGDLKKPSPCSTTPVCKHKFGLPEETVLPPKNTGSLSGAEQSPFFLESLFSHENTDESMGSATAHTKNGFDDSKDCHVKSGLENTHVSKPYSLNDIVEGISKNDDCMQTSQHDNGMEDAIENPSICLATTGYKHEDALSEEAAHALKDYAGTCSSNPRELLMDLQSLFSKGNIKESHPDDGLTFPSAENSGDQSISVEQRVKTHHGSNLSHLGSTDLLDELIGCSNTEVLHQSYNHEDRSNMDRVEQVASEPCTNDIVEAAAAECIESGLVLLPSEERSNLNDGQLNPKLESPTNMGSGLNCDKYVCNTSANGSAVVVVGERTPSGSGLPEDYPKDHYPRQELLDGCSVESSLQGTICRKKIVSAVVGIGSPSSLATHDYKYEGALSKESVCRMKNYTGMSSVDPKHLIMEMQSPHSEGSTEKLDLQDNLAFKYEGTLSKEAVCRMKNYTGMSSVDPKHLIMEMQSPHSEGSTEKPDLQDNLAFPHALNRRDELVICHVEELLAPHVSSEPDTYQRPCEDLSRHKEKESCMKDSLTSVQIDLADDAHLIERDIVAPVEVSCEEKVEIKCMPTSGSVILQEKSYSNGHGICQPHSQKHIDEANFRLSSCGTGTEVIHQDHKEECNEPNEDKFSPKALVENNMSEDAPIEGIMLPLVAGTSEIHDEQLNTKMSDENEELCVSSDEDTIENFCTGPAKGDLYSLPKDFHIETCQKQEVPEVLSLPESAEESAKFQCVGVSGSGPCQQCVNESTSMQPTYNIETVNLDHECNQNNEDQTTPGVSASSVPETVEIEIEQSEMEIGLIPATETSELPVPDEQPNSKLGGNGDQITPGIPTSSVPEAVEIEQSEMEIGLIPAAETSGLPVPDEQPDSKLEGSEVDEHSCSYDKDFFILSDSESLKREASSLNKDDCKDMSTEDNHPNDLPAPRSPEPSAYIQNDNELGSVGISQSSRRSGISELRAKLQSFKVSSTVKGSYIAMGAPRPKPGDSMSQSAVALLRNIENTPAVKAGHPVKPNADGKDSSRRALLPISGRPREH